MSEDGEKDQEKEPKRPSRPVTAAARRERRASARPVTGKAGSDDDATKRPAQKGKAADGKTTGKDKPTPKRDGKNKNKQPSIFARLSRFLREVWAELRKVIWPTRKQMVTYTGVVLAFVVFMVGLVTVLDLVFLKGMDFVFGN